jgi:hypothetical protein
MEARCNPSNPGVDEVVGQDGRETSVRQRSNVSSNALVFQWLWFKQRPVLA